MFICRSKEAAYLALGTSVDTMEPAGVDEGSCSVAVASFFVNVAVGVSSSRGFFAGGRLPVEDPKSWVAKAET